MKQRSRPTMTFSNLSTVFAGGGDGDGVGVLQIRAVAGDGEQIGLVQAGPDDELVF